MWSGQRHHKGEIALVQLILKSVSEQVHVIHFRPQRGIVELLKINGIYRDVLNVKVM